MLHGAGNTAASLQLSASLLFVGKLWSCAAREAEGYEWQGESVEEAVAREVQEEAGVPLASIQLLGSQPWPIGSTTARSLGVQGQSHTQVKEVCDRAGLLNAADQAWLFCLPSCCSLGLLCHHACTTTPMLLCCQLT